MYTLLEYPDGFKDLSKEDYSEICNGAGPKNFGYLVPDSLFFLDCTIAFDIHDYMYHYKYDKAYADTIMLNNLYKIIDSADSWRWVEKIREGLAEAYYMAVDQGGEWFYS